MKVKELLDINQHVKNRIMFILSEKEYYSYSRGSCYEYTIFGTVYDNRRDANNAFRAFDNYVYKYSKVYSNNMSFVKCNTENDIRYSMISGNVMLSFVHNILGYTYV